jgi:hypothetical protein
VKAFMAECFWPGVTEQQVVEAGTRARQAARSAHSSGGRAHYLGAILVPADEIALCLLEAPSIEAALDVNRRAELPSERVIEIMRLTPR